ncbi:Na+/H+ antiporter subunit E [Clostridiaceae bacterium 35-E11]
MHNLHRYIVIFMLFWIILTEKINAEIIIIGLLICMFVYYLNQHSIFSLVRKETKRQEKIYYWCIYLLILIKEIVLANFEVAKIVLSPRMKISPEIVQFHTKLCSDIHKTILANSITLTPGTLTVLMEENTLTVHCLKKDYVEAVLDSKFEKILLKIEE